MRKTNESQIFDPSGNYVGKFDSTGVGNGSFDLLRSIAIDSDDNVYVADIGEIKRVNVDPTCVAGIPPGGTSADRVICAKVRVVSDISGIHIFGPSGNYLRDLDILGDGKILEPSGIHFDDTDGVYVSDTGRNQIYVKRDVASFEVANPTNGPLIITIPAKLYN